MTAPIDAAGITALILTYTTPLQTQITALTARVTTLETRATATETAATELAARVSKVETWLKSASGKGGSGSQFTY